MLERSLRERIMDGDISEEELCVIKNEIRNLLINLINIDGNAINNMKAKILLDKDIAQIIDKFRDEVGSKNLNR